MRNYYTIYISILTFHIWNLGFNSYLKIFNLILLEFYEIANENFF